MYRPALGVADLHMLGYARHFPFLGDASSSKAGTQRLAFELGNLPQRDDLSNLRDRSAERRLINFILHRQSHIDQREAFGRYMRPLKRDILV